MMERGEGPDASFDFRPSINLAQLSSNDLLGLWVAIGSFDNVVAAVSSPKLRPNAVCARKEGTSLLLHGTYFGPE